MKRINHGALSHENCEQIASQIVEICGAKLFTAARATTNEEFHEVDVETNAFFIPDWTEDSGIAPDTLVHASVKDEFASIHFSAGGYSFIFLSRLRTGRNHESFTHPYFTFDHNAFTVTDKLPDNNRHGERRLRKYTFKVQGPMVWDTDEYHERWLKAHWKATGQELPELV